MTDLEWKVVQACLKQINAPYIWCGKGDFLWSPGGPKYTDDCNSSKVGFDCSGLFTWALKEAGLKDRRLISSAATLWATLEPIGDAATALEVSPLAAFYGSVGAPITHIAIHLKTYGELLCLEAAGGDHTTLTRADAAKRGASVRLGRPLRHDLVGYRRLPRE